MDKIMTLSAFGCCWYWFVADVAVLEADIGRESAAVLHDGSYEQIVVWWCPFSCTEEMNGKYEQDNNGVDG